MQIIADKNYVIKPTPQGDTLEKILFYLTNCKTFDELECYYSGVKIYSKTYKIEKKEIDECYLLLKTKLSNFIT